MSDALGIGQLGSAYLSAQAVKSATNKQIKALEQQREFVFKELEPGKIGGAALERDIARAQERLMLQKQIDPELYATRRETSAQVRQMAAGLGEGSPADIVGRVAAAEGISGIEGMEDAKQKLVDAALQELELGATLPPDVQAELVQAGLQKTGMVTGAATAKGSGGELLRRLVGGEALRLKAERQQRAADLVGRAQQVDESRQRLLQSLFPSLAQVQLANLAGASGALQQVNLMTPDAGLGGTDVANLWLARVGATNQLAQSSADAAARSGIAQGQIWGNAIGGLSRSAGSTDWSNLIKQWTTPSNPTGGGGGGRAAYGAQYYGAGGEAAAAGYGGGGSYTGVGAAPPPSTGAAYGPGY